MNPVVLIDGRPAQMRPRGMGIYALRLLTALAELKNKRVELKVALDRRQVIDPWPQLDSVEKIWGAGFNPAYWEQLVLPRLAVKAKANLLHCTANASPWRIKIPVIATIHDVLFMRGFFKGSGVFHPRLLVSYIYYHCGVPRSAKRAKIILTDSEYSKKELVRRLDLNMAKIRVVPLADPNLAPPLPEAKVQETIAALQIKRPYVLGFGAVDLRKNTANLVRAFARLPRSGAEMLVLAGFELSQLSSVPKLIAKLEVADRVKVLGYVSDQELTVLFQGAAVFVYPTRMEGFGLPILQAFHLGVPAISSQVGSIPEVAGNACRYADPEDPRSICQEIMTVLTDSAEAHRLALAGYLQAKHFSWEQTAGLTYSAYLEALGLAVKETSTP